MNHAIVNPPVDRNKAADDVKDVFITIDKETDAGIQVAVGVTRTMLDAVMDDEPVPRAATRRSRV